MKRLALLLILCTAAMAQQPVRVNRSRFADKWNEIEAAVDRINTTRTELGENIKRFAPWFVDCQPKQQRRRELYESAARDAELIAKRYRELCDLEQQRDFEQ